MKIGSLTISLKEQKRKPPLIEIGAPGTMFFSGYLVEEEYNTDLKGDKGIEVYERMRRSDGQVKAALLACSLPLRSAFWDIQAASDSRQDQMIAETIRENLFDGMTITWDDFLRHVLLMYPFGFMVFEKVWELKNGVYLWRKLAPRLPKTIKQWFMDPEGGLERMVQRAWINEQYKDVELPIEKALVFSLEREGSNYQGISLLRAAYKHWYFKDQLYKIDGIAAERHGIGVALFKLPPTASTEGSDSDYGKIEQIGESLHAHERSYIALPSDYEFDLKGVTGQLHDIIRSIEHHDMQIVRSILAQFINLGSSEVGSYALSQDQSGFFLMALRAVGRNICDTMNRYAIRQLVDYNWDVMKYPKLIVSGLEHIEIGTFSKALSDLVTAGVLLSDRAIEAEVRRILHLPAAKVPESRTPTLRLSELPRRPRGAEVYVMFEEIDEKLTSAEDKFVKAAKKIQDKQISQITGEVVSRIERGDLEKVVTVGIPYLDDMAGAVEEVLLDLFTYGKQQVKQEIQRQKGTVKGQEPLGELEEEGIKDFIRTRGKATAQVLAQKLRAAMSWEALRQLKAGIVDRTAMRGALTELSDKELIATAKFSVSEAFNLGRQVEARTEADEIDRVIYSALLDTHTCGPCADLDSREYSFPSAEWDDVTPPYKDCEGHDRCRCVGVYVYRTERRGA